MKKVKSLIIMTVVLVSLLAVINPVSAPPQPTVVWVDAVHGNDTTGSGTQGSPYATIGKGISVVATGGTVYVAAGTYDIALGETFPITINKNLTLIGDGASVTIIDGSLSDVINVNVGVIVDIKGFTIMNGNNGIYYNNGASGTISNNTITGNAQYGIANSSSSPAITNNTITGNLSGIYNDLSSNPTITNNIIVLNTHYGIYNDVTSTSTNSYNDVWNNAPDYGGATQGIGSISADPRLDATYHLTSSSPCIDAGTDAGVYTDMDGDSRPLGAGFDIGADEYVPQLVNPIAAFMPVKNYHLRQVNTCLGCITENLPEDVPEDVQTLLDEMQEHINNANTTGNSIYANNELLKALKCAEGIQEKLGITCPL